MQRLSYIFVLCALSLGLNQFVHARNNNYTYAAAALVGTDMYMNAEENAYTKYSQTQEAAVLRGILHVLRPGLLLPAYSCVSKEFQHSIHPHVKKASLALLVLKSLLHARYASQEYQLEGLNSNAVLHGFRALLNGGFTKLVV